MSNERIQGELRPPLFIPVDNGNSIFGTYHWVTDDQRHTFLHLTLSKQTREPFIVARDNVDSSEIRGQGEALWSFLQGTLLEMITKYDISILHEVHPNEHSLQFPANDPRYFPGRSGNEFYGLYIPG